METKIPPPLVAFIIGLGMWYLADFAPVFLPTGVRLSLALLIAALGAGISIAGMVSFRKARTTVNPLKPQAATSLVTTGIYAVTRNPMYLGMVLVLIGWAGFLASPISVMGPVLFWLYIDRFQIQPEERAMSALFGSSFAEYSARVRRWI
ncbi:MAG TPA: isoprenylcysteine carboxylmethyltransferase family protein [Burkholderiales bacterium]|nr:isoprenylcysteine carboxylmethyltransferase family protein [Burkholderiales bacterium]